MKRYFTILSFFTIFSPAYSADASSWWDMELGDVREKINQRIMSIEAQTPSVLAVRHYEVGSGDRKTPIRVYTPAEENGLPVVLFIHGGAWVAGNLDTHDNMARYLCSQVRCVVVSVGYMNAPEGKFPMQLEQCRDALVWIIDNAGMISADSKRIAVVGDSAGGNMAAALCLMDRDRHEGKIALQVLINPALDLSCNGSIYRQNDLLDTLRWQAFQYVKDSDDVYLSYVSPLLADDLSGLPSTLVILAEYDDLREGGQEYAERLFEAGVPTYVYCQKGVGHLAGDGARASVRSHESLNVAVEAIRALFITKGT